MGQLQASFTVLSLVLVFSHLGAGVNVATLYDKNTLRGSPVSVDGVGCQNLHSFNKKVSSLSVHDKVGGRISYFFVTNLTSNSFQTSCIRLHDQFGCQGHHLDVVSESLCSTNLALCDFDNTASSVSGCDYKLATMNGSGSYPLTTRGVPCSSPCTMGKGTHYFWCVKGSSSWDYCSPQEGLDYYGNVCSAPCARRGYSYSWCPCEGCRYNSRRRGWTQSWGYCS